MAKAKATAPAPRMQPSALTRAHIFGCLERNVDRVCGDLKLTPKAADKMKGALTSVLQDHIDVQLQRRTKSA
jgi:hypothetical protein